MKQHLQLRSKQQMGYSPEFSTISCDRTVGATDVGTVVTVQATDLDQG